MLDDDAVDQLGRAVGVQDAAPLDEVDQCLPRQVRQIHVDALAGERDPLLAQQPPLLLALGEGAVGAHDAVPRQRLLGVHPQNPAGQAGSLGAEVSVGGDEALGQLADQLEDLLLAFEIGHRSLLSIGEPDRSADRDTRGAQEVPIHAHGCTYCSRLCPCHAGACQIAVPVPDLRDMPTPNSAPTPSLSTHLREPIEVGEPDVSGPLAVYPLFGPAPTLEYVAFAAAHEKVAITELEGSASVNDLIVHNQGSSPVLLYEGEEILGAQQNRVLDISILIAAESKTRIPVSCVEQGRWDGRRHRERFRPSPQAADPRMRRLKNKRARMNAAAGMQARADQGEVWKEVAARGVEMDAPSPTGAMSDIYESHRDRLGSIREAVGLHEKQCGSVAVIGGRIAMLDYVSRADAFAALQPALLEGYALDALAQERQRDPEPAGDGEVDIGTVRGFTLLACDANDGPRERGPGLGETARFATNGVEGSALLQGDELVQITGFPSDDDSDAGGSPDAGPSAGRIRRPSRRRGR